MGDLGESFFGLAADTLGGRIGSDEVGVVGFEALQLAHEVVEVGVGDRRLVEDVIEVLVVADLVAEGVDLAAEGRHRALVDLLRKHGATASITAWARRLAWCFRGVAFR